MVGIQTRHKKNRPVQQSSTHTHASFGLRSTTRLAKDIWRKTRACLCASNAGSGGRRCSGITATSRAAGAAHLGHHSPHTVPQVRLSHTAGGFTYTHSYYLSRFENLAVRS